MPAPLGKTPTKKMPKIDVLGIDDSASTRSAVRFFRERRIVVRFVDLRKKSMTPAELRYFLDRLGPALLDVTRAGLPLVAGASNTKEGISVGELLSLTPEKQWASRQSRVQRVSDILEQERWSFCWIKTRVCSRK